MALTAYRSVRLPDRLGYGSTLGPGFNTNLIVLDSGFKHAASRWDKPRRRYTLSLKNRKHDEIAEIISFYHVMMGQTTAFRFKDQVDFTSADNGQDDPGVSDQVLAPVSGVWRLIKTYSQTSNPYTRLITKPVSGTVVLRDGGVIVTPTIDYETGIITYTPSGTFTASFEFDVKVRFNSPLRTSIDDYDALACEDLELIEVL